MKHLPSLSLGKLTALCTLGAVGILLGASGQQMFSPGPLNSQTKPNVSRGGVASHAELSNNCAACHASPWTSETMAGRCLDCHADIRKELDTHQPLHGKMTAGMECRKCHTEHHGPQGALTLFHHFDHDWTAFKLTGKHRLVECRSCHVDQVWKGVAQTCHACHAEPTTHKGLFGTNCIQCHTTSSWHEASFEHKFPIYHGNGKKGNQCATCHTDLSNLASYTCHNCHRHERSKTEKKHLQKGIVNIQDCAGCHPNGRKLPRAASLMD